MIYEIHKFCWCFLQKEKLLKDQAQSELKNDGKLPTGALIKLDGLEEGLSLSALKKKLSEELKWNVGFVDYTAGEPNAYVRLQEENSAKDVRIRRVFVGILFYFFLTSEICLFQSLSKLTDNSFEIDGITIKAEAVEGEKEVEVLQKMEADKNSRVLQNFIKLKTKG